MKHLKTLLLLLASTPLGLAGETDLRCAKTEFRYEVKSGDLRSGTADLCVAGDAIHLYPVSCRDRLPACAKELRDSAPKGENEPIETNPAFGSPGFRNCRKLAGTPRFAEFKIKNAWLKIASCFFKDDSLILDNDTLFGLTR